MKRNEPIEQQLRAALFPDIPGLSTQVASAFAELCSFTSFIRSTQDDERLLAILVKNAISGIAIVFPNGNIGVDGSTADALADAYMKEAGCTASMRNERRERYMSAGASVRDVLDLLDRRAAVERAPAPASTAAKKGEKKKDEIPNAA